MLVRCRQTGWVDPDETGWFGSKLVKSVKKGVSSVAKVAGKAVSAVPVVGAGAAIVKGVAQGKSIGNIAKSAVTSAVPGGAVGRAALRAGVRVAQGGNVARAVGGEARTAIATSKTASTIARTAGRVASGENLVRVARSEGGRTVQDLNRTYGRAVANVPVVGTAASIGLGTAASLAQGKTLAAAAKDAALQAVPGGELVQRGIRVGLDVARGKNVASSVAQQGIDYARSNIPGGELAQRGLNVALGVAKGGNIASTVGREGLALATNAAPSAATLAQTLPGASQMPGITRPNWGQPRSASPEHVRAARSIVGVTRPQYQRGISPVRERAASFRPLSQTTRTWLVRALPHMRGEVSGLSESGAQYIVEKGDTGSGIAKKLTGNANRWTELKSVNPTIMNRGADLVKKYGFPIYVGDKVNLPASWIKPTAKPPAQTAPATPTATTPPPVEVPQGNIAAQGQARTILVAWGKSDGKGEAGVGDYGSQAELGATSWTARDVMQATSFANWWRKRNGTPTVADGTWSDSLAVALNRWAEQKANALAASASAATGIQSPTPAAPSPVNAPLPSVPQVVTPAPTPAPAPPATVSTSPVALPPSIATTGPIVGGDPLSLPPAWSTPAQTQSMPAPAPQPVATASQTSTPAGVPDSVKWGWGSIILGTVLSAAVRHFQTA